jgi:hypothetical protein
MWRCSRARASTWALKPHLFLAERDAKAPLFHGRFDPLENTPLASDTLEKHDRARGHQGVALLTYKEIKIPTLARQKTAR